MHGVKVSRQVFALFAQNPCQPSNFRGRFCAMKLLTPILGGVAGIFLATSAFANDLIRPIAREDALQMKVAAQMSALAAFRVVPRPDHMIRYPVAVNLGEPTLRPVARAPFLPRTRWEHKPGNPVWTRAAMSAIATEDNDLESVVPTDIDRWCPAYTDNPPELRRAFWVGMMSALAKHESTYNPEAVGGPNLWYGLLQIYPDTARRYGCRATTGEALKNPTENLSCAARIMNVTVARDRAIAVYNGRWRGVAADWGPMSNPSKIPEMANWTRQQSYCVPVHNIRPRARPEAFYALAGPTPTIRPQARPLDATISTMNIVVSLAD